MSDRMFIVNPEDQAKLIAEFSTAFDERCLFGIRTVTSTYVPSGTVYEFQPPPLTHDLLVRNRARIGSILSESQFRPTFVTEVVDSAPIKPPPEQMAALPDEWDFHFSAWVFAIVCWVLILGVGS